MAGSLNKVCLIGNLGADPEIRRTQSGNPVASFSIATSETWRDRNSGEKKEKTDWHNVVIWNEGLCKVAEQYLKKAPRFTSRASFRPANGSIPTVATGTPPKLFSSSTPFSSCSPAATTVAPVVAVTTAVPTAVTAISNLTAIALTVAAPLNPTATRLLPATARTWTMTFRSSREIFE